MAWFGYTFSVTDPLGNTTVYGYDLRGNRTYEGGATYPVRYAYDIFGEKVTMTTYRDEAQADGDTTTWLYDEPSGLVTNKLYADGKGPSYTYTPNGDLAARTWARGVVTTYAYDGWGSLTNTVYSDGTPAVAYAYDGLGRMVSAIADGVSTNRYTYSGSGQIAGEIQNGAALSRSYDAFDRPTGYTLNVGNSMRQVAYAYDGGSGRLSSVSSGGRTFAYAYLPGTDRVSGYACGDFARTVAYEERRDLIAAVTNAFGGGCVSAFAYVNDAAGRRTSVTRSGTALGPLSGAVDTYGYNSRSEVISSRRTLGGNPVWAFANDYAYDPIGNRTSSAVYDGNGVAAESVYTANPLNQYIRVSSLNVNKSFLYDDDGNMVADGSFNYAWDAENRLVSVTPIDAAVSQCHVKCTRYMYDYQYRKIKEISYVQTLAESYEAKKSFVYDDINLILETVDDHERCWDKVYVWGIDITGSLFGAGGVGALLLAAVDNEDMLFCNDANGNIVQVVSPANVNLAHYEYGDFGDPIVADGELNAKNTFRFSSKTQSDLFGFLYYGYRFYQPSIGRWMSRDMIDSNHNLYLFALNRPIYRYDVRGLVTPPEELEYQKVECNRAIKLFWDNNPKWKTIRDWFENPPRGSKKGKCRLRSISCKCCQNSSDQGSFRIRTKPPYPYDRDGVIELCYNNIKHYPTTLAHEIMHYFDFCGDEECDIKDNDYDECRCYKDFCSEYRANYITGACSDHESCWKLLFSQANHSGNNYWMYYNCDVLVGNGDSDKERIKKRLRDKCRFDLHMPPKPFGVK